MTLNLESFDEKSKKKSTTKYKAALGVGSVVSLFGIGSTLAANISLNGGGNVEFGQGVATTAACDEDGFSITPVTSYDNEHSIFRVDYVQVEGLNLTPEGTGYALSGSGVTDQNNDATIDQSDAKSQYPGQYYDGNDWKRTCDNVVLDFKAYTTDTDYALYTDDAYTNPSNTSITSPVGWAQDFESGTSDLNISYAPGFAAIVNTGDDGESSNYVTNFAVDAVNLSSYPSSLHGFPYNMSLSAPQWNLTTSNATFRFYANNAHPNAASISKITVQSMKEFPRSYYAMSSELGNPSVSAMG